MKQVKDSMEDDQESLGTTYPTNRHLLLLLLLQVLVDQVWLRQVQLDLHHQVQLPLQEMRLWQAFH